MEVSIITYHLNEVPTKLVDLLEEEHSQLSSLLSLGPYIDEGNSYESFLEDIEDYPIKTILPPSLVNQVRTFLEDKELVIAYNYDDGASIKNLFYLRKLIGEQLTYFETDFEDECQVYYILVKVDGSPYGGVFCFYNPSLNKDILLFQGIVKYSIHTLISLYLPEYANRYPKLNSLLEEPIATLAKNLGAKELLVYPIGNQAKILKNHYGYQQGNLKYLPTEHLLGKLAIKADNVTSYTKKID